VKNGVWKNQLYRDMNSKDVSTVNVQLQYLFCMGQQGACGDGDVDTVSR